MKMLLSLLIILLGFLVSGVWFGTTLLIGRTRFGKMEYTHYFLPIISAILPLSCILPFQNPWPVDFARLLDLKMWGIVLLTAVLVNAFIFLFIRRPYTKQKKLHAFLALVEAGSMEIPMRLMMMNFTMLLLARWNLPSWLSIGFTGIIWCMAIVVQAIAYGERLKDAVVEIVASMLFSLGIGYVYYSTGLILFPMVGHILERLIGTGMKRLVPLP